jgi:diadenosine tetraphosphate (Ap4A) HIT family hydrolase
MLPPIYENSNFAVVVPEKPFIDRLEGGHVVIKSKIPVRDRTKLTKEQALEYTLLSMFVGEALTMGMQKQGVDIGLVNYQDMGNWSVFKPEGPILHMHIFGRATTATVQKYGDAVKLPHRETGFYDTFKPLSSNDIEAISGAMLALTKTQKYDIFMLQ